MDELDVAFNSKFRVVEDYNNPSLKDTYSVGDKSTTKLSVKVSQG